jgi:hypothetical protein
MATVRHLALDGKDGLHLNFKGVDRTAIRIYKEVQSLNSKTR